MTHHRAKLTAEDVAGIRTALAKGYQQRFVAASYGVSQSTVSMIARNLTWKPTTKAQP